MHNNTAGYLCIPNHDIGCKLSDFSDILWNEERLGSLMRKVDAVTVATGLLHLPALANDDIWKILRFTWAVDSLNGFHGSLYFRLDLCRQQCAIFPTEKCICRRHCAVNGINIGKIIRRPTTYSPILVNMRYVLILPHIRIKCIKYCLYILIFNKTL